jgi:hypothetical protein
VSIQKWPICSISIIILKYRQETFSLVSYWSTLFFTIRHFFHAMLGLTGQGVNIDTTTAGGKLTRQGIADGRRQTCQGVAEGTGGPE